MAPLYDLMLMLDAAAPSDRRTQILAEVEKAIQAKGSIESKHDWGVRTMTYEIEHQPEADYHLLQFKGDAGLLEQLGRTLRLTDGVIRFRIIKLAPGTPPPPAVRAEPRADAADAASAAPVVAEAPAVGEAAPAAAEAPGDAEAPPAATADAPAATEEAPPPPDAAATEPEPDPAAEEQSAEPAGTA